MISNQLVKFLMSKLVGPQDVELDPEVVKLSKLQILKIFEFEHKQNSKTDLSLKDSLNSNGQALFSFYISRELFNWKIFTIIEFKLIRLLLSRPDCCQRTQIWIC